MILIIPGTKGNRRFVLLTRCTPYSFDANGCVHECSQSRSTYNKRAFTHAAVAFQYLSHNFNEIPRRVAVSEFQSTINNGSDRHRGKCQELWVHGRRGADILFYSTQETRSKRRTRLLERARETVPGMEEKKRVGGNRNNAEVFHGNENSPVDNRNFSRRRIPCLRATNPIAILKVSATW